MEYLDTFNQIKSRFDADIRIEFYKSKGYNAGRAFKKDGYWLLKLPHLYDLERLHVAFHELGHAVNNGNCKQSCLREYYADQFANQCFSELGLPTTVDIDNRHRWYMAYSLGQALNRGLKKIPSELKPYKKYLKSHEQSIVTCKNGKQTVKRVLRFRVMKHKDTEWS